jgi:hypothetical protein
MSNRLQSPDALARIAMLEARVEWLTKTVVAGIVRQAEAEAPGRTVKALAIDTNYSPSAIRKWAHARPEGERYRKVGGRVYLREEALPPRWRKGAA